MRIKNFSKYSIIGFIRFAYKKSNLEVKKKFIFTHIFIILTAIFDNAVSYSLLFIIDIINKTSLNANNSINNNIIFILIIYSLFLIAAAVIRSKALLFSFKSAALISTSSDNLIFKKYINSQYEKASSISSSELVNLIINHSTALNYNLFYPYFMVLYSSIIITFFSFIFIINLPKLALISIISLYLIYLLLFTIEKSKVINLSENYSRATKILSTKLLDSVKLFRETKLNKKEIQVTEDLNQIQKIVRISQAKVAFKGKMPKFIIEAIILFSLALLALKSKIITGNILENYKFQISLLCIGKLYPSFQNAYANFSNMIASKASIRAYLDIYKKISKELNLLIETKNKKLEHQDSTTNIEKIENLPDFNILTLSNICFQYQNNQRIIFNKISIEIYRGEKIFISGNSGSGKTTLINLIMGLLEPTSGEILFNGLDKKKFGQEKNQLYFSLVSQSPYLRLASIIENITDCSKISEVNKSLFYESLEIADCTSFIKNIDKGIFEMVGEGGLILSGGQQQRLTIARALYQDKPILVLDEATNSLDLKSQQKILQNIIKFRPTKTIIGIFHDVNAKEYFTSECKVYNNKIEKVSLINKNE